MVKRSCITETLSLLHSFWNHVWSLQSDWLSSVQAYETALLKHNNQSDIKTCLKEPIKLQENERQLLQLFTNLSSVLDQQNICKDWKNLYVNKWNLQFQIRYNKVVIELCVMQFWSCLIMKFCKSFLRT